MMRRNHNYHNDVIVTFRLNPSSPDETRALAVLAAWKERGHTVRQAITAGLLALDGRPVPDVINDNVELTVLRRDMDALMEQMTSIMDDLQRVDAGTPRQQVDDLRARAAGVSQTLLDNIANAIHWGDDDDE